MKTIFPPHPNTKITPASLPTYEQHGKWVAQRKFNGTHILVWIGPSPDREVGILTRHGTPPKLFSLSPRHVEQLRNLNLEPDKGYWLEGELLDHKTTSKEYKEKLVLFDVLQAGRYLYRSPKQPERLEILANICRHPIELEPNKGIALQVSPDIWMAETWDTDFTAHYEKFLHLPEIEGLVLRKKDSVIDNFGAKEYDVNWILRCRKPHLGGNYSF